MSENTNEYSTKHPHEPEIPATYDDEGRCLICGLLVQVAKLEEENEALKDTIRIDWEVIVDAIDDHDIKQAVIKLWNRANALLKKEQSNVR